MPAPFRTLSEAGEPLVKEFDKCQLIPRDVRWRWPKLAPGAIVQKMTVQEAQSAAVYGPASSTATGSRAASSGPASSTATSSGATSSGATSSELQATAAAAPATASVASDLPPSLEQAHPDDKTELANLLDKVTGRNRGA